jgi:hypothetical protein
MKSSYVSCVLSIFASTRTAQGMFAGNQLALLKTVCFLYQYIQWCSSPCAGHNCSIQWYMSQQPHNKTTTQFTKMLIIKTCVQKLTVIFSNVSIFVQLKVKQHKKSCSNKSLSYYNHASTCLYPYVMSNRS